MSTRKNNDDPNNIEDGGHQITPVHDRMSQGDKIALSAIGAVFLVIALGLMLVAKWFLSTFFGMFQTIDDGLGFRTAFLIGTGISFATIILFAIVAGEGVVGELPTMIIGFFVMILFFTLSLAMVF
ncbi:MAG: hypothetical protein ABJN42_20965 [Roseibium sp.]|uniref:hypothetical protein n=1 Tax=Roseibium sp. TaxID=1936156 RepID=UPI00329971C2